MTNLNDLQGFFYMRNWLPPSSTSILEFLLPAVAMPGRERDSYTTPPPDSGGPVVKGSPRPSKLSFGKYHALVVGNNDYRQLPRLRTGVNDAQEVIRYLKILSQLKVQVLVPLICISLVFVIK